jgi:CubicO group peptidase (beta-lactamase class C family)
VAPPSNSSAVGQPLADAVQLVQARGVPAQLCVIHVGRTILDLAVNCRLDDLFWLFSAGKPFIALLVHKLAEDRLLDLDDPVARNWPGFAPASRLSAPL